MDEAPQILEVDILFVGGGPANLSGALRLTQLIANHNALVSAGETSGPPLAPRIALIEKGRDVGAHAIDGKQDLAAAGEDVCLGVVQHGAVDRLHREPALEPFEVEPGEVGAPTRLVIRDVGAADGTRGWRVNGFHRPPVRPGGTRARI